MGLTIDR
jgi:hypothetical protein